MSRPVLVAVDEDSASLSAVERELVDRYERSYRVVCVGSAAAAEAELAGLADAGDDVALVLAGDSLGGEPGSELLGRVRRLHPQAQRGLLIDYASWGHDPTGEAILTAMALRQIDYYLIRPTRNPDELFHQATSMPGVFAVGDVRHGAVNRVASAVGEGSIAVRLVHELIAARQRAAQVLA